MALHIEEFAYMGQSGDGGPIPIAGPAIALQTRTLTTTSAQSTAFNAATKFVRLCADVACYYTFGTNPTATTGSTLLPAGVVEYRAVQGSEKLAARSVA